ncbi:hypothetical protein [Sphaerisporangium flaviroseum]|uniref:hypothetical protein n=1 Tax=Sphaerisporangium flaviroseum TaxID=509199 RepID=UPI0031F1296A
MADPADIHRTVDGDQPDRPGSTRIDPDRPRGLPLAARDHRAGAWSRVGRGLLEWAVVTLHGIWPKMEYGASATAIHRKIIIFDNDLLIYSPVNSHQ